MGRDFYDQFSRAREVFQQADDLLGMHLSRLIFEGPAEELRETVNCQLAIYVTGLAIAGVVHEQVPNLKPTACAGHSLGEYTALTYSGRLTLPQGLELVRRRGQLMQEACKRSPGTMAAVIGLTVQQLEERLAGMLGKGVWLGNINAPDQVILTGTRQGVEAASEAIRSGGGAKVVALEVAGAFHSPLMQEAAEELAQALRATFFQEQAVPVVMNRSGKAAVKSDEVLAQLVEQMRNPVQWVETLQTLGKMGINRWVEFGPGRVLTGLGRRNGALGDWLNVDKVEDLEKIA
jgi:[acyl-carrier-protein] S-malonyltransferase